MPSPEENCPVDWQARIVKLETSLQALKDVLAERDIRYSQRSKAQDTAVEAALGTSKEAVTKAEIATEKRLETLNELRQVVVDQSRDFARKAEVNLLIDGMEKRIEAISTVLSSREAHGGGIKDAFGWIAGTAGLALAALAIYFRH